MKITNKKLSIIKSYLEEYKSVKVEEKITSKSKKSSISKLFVYYDKSANELEITNHPFRGDNITYLVKGLYDGSNMKIGWDRLFIKTKNSGNSILQCWAAGYVEGFLTSKSILDHLNNMRRIFRGSLEQFDQLKDIYKQIDKQFTSKLDADYFLSLDKESLQKWTYYACIKAQMEGLERGHNINSKIKLEKEDFYILNSVGNIEELKMYLDVSKFEFENDDPRFYHKSNYQKFFNISSIYSVWINEIMRSSAIIKLVKTNNKTDLFIGHTTVKDYSFLYRTLKIYNFDFEDDVPAFPMRKNKISFSSYPGALYSGDDFYITNNNLCICRTSLTPINFPIYKLALDHKDYIPDFMRIMAANLFADNAIEWFEIFKTFGSRLYSSQWLISDYKQLNQISDKLNNKNLLTVIEEVPGTIQIFDMTKNLEELTYFGSFNIPNSAQIQEIFGIKYYSDMGVNILSEKFNARNLILKKLQNNVKNIDDFANLISYNGYGTEDKHFPEDPSKNNPRNAISPRYDLLKNPIYKGGIDFKMINNDLINQKKIIVKAGPTFIYNDNLKPFKFSLFYNDTELIEYKKGIPNVFKYDAIYLKDIYKED